MKKIVLLAAILTVLFSVLLLVVKDPARVTEEEVEMVPSVLLSEGIPEQSPAPIEVSTQPKEESGIVYTESVESPVPTPQPTPRPVSHRIHGRVTDADGNGIEGVEVIGGTSPRYPMKSLTDGLTDSKGNYLLEYAIAPTVMNFSLTLRYLPYGMHVYPEYHSVTVPADTLTEFNFLAEQGILLSGKVVGPAKDEILNVDLRLHLMDAAISADSAAGGSSYPIVVNADGSFLASIPDWPEDSIITVIAKLPNYTIYEKKLFKRDFPIIIEMGRRSKLQLKVVYDDNDEPVFPFEYSFGTPSGFNTLMYVDNGTNESALILPGFQYTALLVRARRGSDKVAYHDIITIPMAEWPDSVVEARLKPTDPFRFRVIDAATKEPIEGAEAFRTKASYFVDNRYIPPSVSGVSEDIKSAIGISDANGNMIVTVDSLSVSLKIVKDGYLDRTYEGATYSTHPEARTVDFPLYKLGRIEGILLDEHGKPKSNSPLKYNQFQDQLATSHQIYFTTLDRNAQDLTTDDNGRFLLHDLIPGIYTFRDPETAEANQGVRVVLESGQTVQIVIGGQKRAVSFVVCVNDRLLDDPNAQVEVTSLHEGGTSSQRFILTRDATTPGRYTGVVPPGAATIRISSGSHGFWTSGHLYIPAHLEKPEVNVSCLYSLEAEAILIFPDDSYRPDGRLQAMVRGEPRRGAIPRGLSVIISQLNKEPMILRYTSTDGTLAGESEEFIPKVGERVVVPIDIRPVSQ